MASGGALSRGTLRRNLGVRLPSNPLRNPARRQAQDTLDASGGHHCDGGRLKANSGNDYREVVTRKLAVPNPFAKSKQLYLTLTRQDTREAIRARHNKEPTGTMGYNCPTVMMSREVEQIIKTEDTVTVIVKDDYTGNQYSGSASINYWGSEAAATEKATQDALNK